MNELFIVENFKTTNWSGGKTTELFIYPKGSTFKEGSFDFRLSTASVEVDESVFTELPNVQRSLMVLDGEIELTHLNQHKKVLKKFDSDYFDGGWTTYSKGKCIDFNLMTKGKVKGTLNAVILSKKTERKYELIEQSKKCFMYLIKGVLEVSSEDQKTILKQGGLLSLDCSNTSVISKSQTSEYIFIDISLK